MHRVLLLIPRTSYRAEDFLEAARELGVQVVVGSNHRGTLARLVPDATMYLDFKNIERSTRRILDYAAKRPLSAIVAVEDEGVEVAAAASERLELPYNPVGAVRAARHKDVMRRALADAGVPSPETRLLSIDDDPARAARAATYPCVLKPVFLSASRGVIRADDPDEFVSAFRRIAAILSDPDLVRRGGAAARRILVERFVPGIEVALEGILDDGRLRTLALLDKPDPLDGPTFEETIFTTPSRLPAAVQTEIITCVERTARALGLSTGPVHAEIRYNDDGAWVIEIAPRSIGGLCSRVLRFGTGLSLEEMIIRHATGRMPESLAHATRASGVMMIPIPRAGTLHGVHGLDRAARVRGVEDVTISIPSGEEVVPLPEGHRYLGFIFARGQSPAEVEVALREAHRRLRFDIEPAPAPEPQPDAG